MRIRRDTHSRRPARWLAGTCLVLAACAREAPRPNLVIVALDTLRPDHLGCYGYERATSPGLDAFAAGAVVFEQAESPAPWTAPAMISLVTGLRPEAHGVFGFPNPGRLNERAVTLAEVLSEHGYRTAAFTEGGYAKGEFGLDQGFEVFPANPGDSLSNMSNVLDPSRLAGNLDRAIAWLADRDDEPFFMFFHTYEVHGPLRAPAEYVRRFDPGWDPEVEHDRLAEVLARWTSTKKIDRAGALLLRNHNFHCAVKPPPGIQQYMHDHGLLPEDGSSFYSETLDFVRDQYDAEIAYTDASLERLWQALRDRGLDERTVVVVVSDHGEALGEHGVVGHGSRHFSEQLRVVLIVRAPGIAPRRVSDPVSSLSVSATALDLLGLPDAAPHGRSLAPLMRGAAAPPDEPALYSQGLSVEGGEERVVSMRQGRWRCILDTETGTAQLYDLEADPEERHDLGPADPERARALAAALTRQTELDRTVRRLESGEVTESQLDDATIRELQGLGYVDREE